MHLSSLLFLRTSDSWTSWGGSLIWMVAIPFPMHLWRRLRTFCRNYSEQKEVSGWQTLSSIAICSMLVTLYCVALVSLNSRTIRAHSSAFDLASPITPFADFKVDDPRVLWRSLIRTLHSNFMFSRSRQLPVTLFYSIYRTCVNNVHSRQRSIGRDRGFWHRERSIQDDTAVWTEFVELALSLSKTNTGISGIRQHWGPDFDEHCCSFAG